MKKIFVFLFLAVMALAVTDLAAQPGRERKGPHGDERGPGRGKLFGDPEMMKAKLGLNDEQIEKISLVNVEYEKKFLEMREKLSPDKTRLRNLLMEDSINLDKVRELLKSIADRKIEIRMLRIMQRLDIEKVLNDDQKSKMKSERMKRFREKPGYGPEDQ